MFVDLTAMITCWLKPIYSKPSALDHLPFTIAQQGHRIRLKCLYLKKVQIPSIHALARGQLVRTRMLRHVWLL